jgi:hypothetical protein
VNGSVTPAEGGSGTIFQVRGQGFQANESLEVWATDPSGTYVLLSNLAKADGSGRVGYSPPLDLSVSANPLPGVYGMHYRSPASGARMDVYFTVTGQAKGIPGAAGWLAAAGQ